jgi:hypothetical protein
MRMELLKELDIVRVMALRVADRAFDGSAKVSRAPAVGDIGTIVHEYLPSELAAPVIVEMVDDGGLTVWLADFERTELEFVQRPG